MKNNVLNDLFIKQVYKKYQEEYKLALPNISAIKYTNLEDAWAQFKAEDLYNQIYVLYIDTETFNKNKKFITQLLYHEFTHLTDSLMFLKESLEEFSNIMTSYSEFHASEIAFSKMINDTENENVNLNTEITHVGILTIQSFIQQSFDFMLNDLKKMAQNSKEDMYYNTNRVYYFYGYIKALKKYHIDYEIATYKIAPQFLLQVQKIQDALLHSNASVTTVVSLHKDLEDAIKNQYIMNNFIHHI